MSIRAVTCKTFSSDKIQTVGACSVLKRIALIVKTIMESLTGLYNSIKQGSRGYAVQMAVYFGYVNIAKNLLNGGAISEGHRNLLFLNGLASSRFDFIEAILQKGSISKNCLGQAIVICSKNGYCAFMEALLAKIEPADKLDDYLGRALQNACLYGYVEIIPTLIKKGTILEHYQENAMNNAIQSGNLSCLPSLIAIGPIADAKKRALINFARESGYYSVEKLLTGIAPVAGDFNLYINREDLKTDPIPYLFNATYRFNKIIFLSKEGIEQKGTDLGGLSKQFIHELLDQLRLKKILNLNERRFPIGEKALTHEIYQNVGKLLSMIDERNKGRSDPIYIGSIFNSKVFEYFQDFIRNRLTKHEQIKKLANHLRNTETEVFVDFLNKDHPTKEEIASFQRYIEKVDWVEEGEYKNLTVKQLHDLCKAPFNGVFEAISSIVSGFSPSLREKILKNGQAYAELLQGPDRFTKEDIFRKFSIQSQDPVLLEKVAWIREKITEESKISHSTWIKRFLSCVTAQPVLPAVDIRIRGINGVSCIARTCLNVLELPLQDNKTYIKNYLSEIKDPRMKRKLAFLESLENIIATSDCEIA